MQRIIPYGERAILIEFEQKIDPLVNQGVHQLNAIIKQAHLPGLSYTVPAYCSLVLVFETKIEQLSLLIEEIHALEKGIAIEQEKTNILKRIPVCYDAIFALDQEDIMERLGLNWEEVIDLHTSQEYLVYMLGFTPGFGFMGKVPSLLQIKRRQTPRTKVPMGSVGLANEQTGIYPEDIPGGWQIIGRTPLKPFDPRRSEPFLLKAGDRVQFYAIDLKTFQELS